MGGDEPGGSSTPQPPPSYHKDGMSSSSRADLLRGHFILSKWAKSSQSHRNIPQKHRVKWWDCEDRCREGTLISADLHSSENASLLVTFPLAEMSGDKRFRILCFPFEAAITLWPAFAPLPVGKIPCLRVGLMFGRACLLNQLNSRYAHRLNKVAGRFHLPSAPAAPFIDLPWSDSQLLFSDFCEATLPMLM